MYSASLEQLWKIQYLGLLDEIHITNHMNMNIVQKSKIRGFRTLFRTLIAE